MGGNNCKPQKNVPKKMEKGKKKGTNISLIDQNAENGNKGKNTINDSSDNINEITVDVVIETLIRIYHFENTIKELCNNEENKNNDSRCVIASKNLIDNYKNHFQLEILKKQFNNQTILKHINNLFSNKDNTKNQNEVIKTNISKIITELNKTNKRLIKNINDNISSLSELDKKVELNHKYLNAKQNKGKVFVNFEIIDFDIFVLLIKQNISSKNFLFADYFISSDQILILIKECGDSKSNVICEVGKYNKRDECIKIEYLLDSEKIEGSPDLKEKLKVIDVSEIYQKISGGKNNNNEIQFKKYDFDIKPKIINNGNNEENEEPLISNENEYDGKNLRGKKNDEKKLNKTGNDSNNLINKENSETDNNQQDSKLIDNSIDNNIGGNKGNNNDNNINNINNEEATDNPVKLHLKKKILGNNNSQSNETTQETSKLSLNEKEKEKLEREKREREERKEREKLEREEREKREKREKEEKEKREMEEREKLEKEEKEKREREEKEKREKEEKEKREREDKEKREREEKEKREREEKEKREREEKEKKEKEEKEEKEKLEREEKEKLEREEKEKKEKEEKEKIQKLIQNNDKDIKDIKLDNASDLKKDNDSNAALGSQKENKKEKNSQEISNQEIDNKGLQGENPQPPKESENLEIGNMNDNAENKISSQSVEKENQEEDNVLNEAEISKDGNTKKFGKIFKDKEDSSDKNEEAEAPDEVNENAEVSPNIENIKKEELKDITDSPDKNEENAGLPDEVDVIAEVNPNIDIIKKEELKDKEDSSDKNEEAEAPDEMNENAEVSPNIENIKKEELKDIKDSPDKNEENAGLPDEVDVIAEVIPNIDIIKKEDLIEDSADKNEENENQDEVGEIDVVPPNLNCFEKEEEKDKADTIDINEESANLPDELALIAEVFTDIDYIEKEKPIEDSADKNEENENQDEVGEIDVVPPNLNCFEKEEEKDKADSIDNIDESAEKPDEMGENAGESPSISGNHKNDNASKQVQDQPSHIILKKFTTPHQKLNAKTKQLLLFSIYQKKMTESDSRKELKENENVILINKDFFEKYFYNEILDLVNEEELESEIDKIDINNFSISSIKNIIIELDNDRIDEINNKISNVNEDEANALLKPKEEEVQLIGKKIKVYNDFVAVNRDILTNFEKIFKINLEEQNVSYVSFNKDFVLKLKNSEQAALILGHFNKDNSSNEVTYILDFNKQEDLNNQFPLVYSYGVDYFVADKLILERGIENDYISPIFNFENIIGYGYKYEPQITDYRNHDNYIRFLNCENLNNILALFSYQMLFEENKRSKAFQNGKYYFVSQEYLDQLKKLFNYNVLSQTISPYEPENQKNLYTFIKKVPSDKLDQYYSYKMEEAIIDENSDSYYMVEPESIAVEYKKDQQILTYDNFFLIDEKSGKSFSDIKENSHFCGECTFLDNKIIVNLPHYLNQISGGTPKFVSLIGNLYVDNFFKIEYILIYANESSRKNHLDSIKKNLKESLRNFKYKSNISTFNFKSDEVIVIKYRKKDNFKLETYFKQRPKIGLDNIGATCYMNSTLQCLTHIDSLVDYFKYDPQIEEVKKNNSNLTSSFKTLVDNLYPKNYLQIHRYAPNDFKEKISVMNPLFKGIAANDAKDLVNFIIMTLHNELNKTDEIPDVNPEQFQNLDQSNKDQAYMSFENDILKDQKSIISDLFYGINSNETECYNCHKTLYNYQTYFFINFPLEVVRQSKLEKMNNMNYMYQMNQQNSNEVDILDCFENERKISMMTGDNQMYCNGCGQNADSAMRTVLVTGPEELILILNRGKGKEFDVKLNFTENLNLYRFIEKKETGYKYKLTGVITHIGESSMSGHFIAFCIDQTTKKWYKYNDSMVDEIKDFETDVINNSNIMPYLLFYHKLSK